MSGLLQRLAQREASRASQNIPDSNGHLLAMPPEIMAIIADGNLTLADQYALANTSAHLRDLFRQDWRSEFSKSKPLIRIEFLTSIARYQLDRWVCSECECLHPMIPHDTPVAPGQLDPAALQRRSKNCQAREKYCGDGSSPGYQLRHYHVQYALRCHALERTEDQYYQQLMRPYRRRYHAHNDPFTLLVYIRPKILEGHFCVEKHAKIKITVHEQKNPFPENPITRVTDIKIVSEVSMGPHIQGCRLTTGPKPCRVRQGPARTLLRAINCQSGISSYRCSKCYSVVYFLAESKKSRLDALHIVTITDLGPYDSPSNDRWSSQAIRDGGSRSLTRSTARFRMDSLVPRFPTENDVRWNILHGQRAISD